MLCKRVGDKERGRGGERRPYRNTSPLLPVSPSPTPCVFLLIVSLLLTGCPREQTQKAPAEPQRASVTLRVLVVNEPPLVEVINRLRGEWAERSGGELTAQTVAWKEIAEGKQLAGDAIIFPSRYLGELCSRGWLRPVRGSVLDDADLKFNDFFPLVRSEVLKWGGETMALPLGLDASAFAVANAKAPSPGISLLLKAGPGAITDEKLGFLFDTDSMKPRIAEAPFVDALKRLAGTQTADNRDASTTVAPGSTSPLPLLGYGDRLIAVTASSHNAASAFRLIAWLAQPDTSTQLARAAEPTLPARSSLATSAQWYRSEMPQEERAKVSQLLTTQLNGLRCVLVPRIPGVDEYLAALDEAVTSATRDKVAAAVALQKAADRWEEITNAHGRDGQHAAYLKHLNIAD